MVILENLGPTPRTVLLPHAFACTRARCLCVVAKQPRTVTDPTTQRSAVSLEKRAVPASLTIPARSRDLTQLPERIAEAPEIARLVYARVLRIVDLAPAASPEPTPPPQPEGAETGSEDQAATSNAPLTTDIAADVAAKTSKTLRKQERTSHG